MNLGDFVKQFAALLTEKKVRMPFKDERPWHIVFYELKKSRDVRGKPAFLETLFFDWDGPYPKSKELSRFLHALHWNATVSASNPHYDTIELPPEIADLWSARFDQLPREDQLFLEHAVECAQEEFGPGNRGAEDEEARTTLA